MFFIYFSVQSFLLSCVSSFVSQFSSCTSFLPYNPQPFMQHFPYFFQLLLYFPGLLCLISRPSFFFLYYFFSLYVPWYNTFNASFSYCFTFHTSSSYYFSDSFLPIFYHPSSSTSSLSSTFFPIYVTVYCSLPFLVHCYLFTNFYFSHHLASHFSSPILPVPRIFLARPSIYFIPLPTLLLLFISFHMLSFFRLPFPFASHFSSYLSI